MVMVPHPTRALPDTLCPSAYRGNISRVPKISDALVRKTVLSSSPPVLITCAAPAKKPLQLIRPSTAGGSAPSSEYQSVRNRCT